MSEEASPPGRLRSLDVFRGATIAGMVLVNNPGDGSKTFAPLLHAEWHGWTPTDWIFPFFLFIVGVAIPFSSAKGHWQIARRVLILFGLGLFLNAFRFTAIDWGTLRIPGVLQRIAVVYGLAALAYRHLKPQARVWLGAGILAAYWAALMLVPVPGHGAGDLSPQGNLAFWLDSRLLGKHTWRLAPGPGDPEGILSTLPALVTALCGLAAGEWLRGKRSPHETATGLFVAGNLGLVAGLALAAWMPLNKNLWTPTYVLATGGVAAIALGLAYVCVDVRGRARWARPFEILGMNAIAAFFGSTLLAKIGILVKLQEADGTTVSLTTWLYRRLAEPWLPDYGSSLAWATAYLLLWLGVVWVLYRKRIFLKV